MKILSIYVDGGVWLKNPSPQGGAYAIRAVDAKTNEVVAEKSVIVRPSDIGTVTVSNNNTELLGVLAGIEEARILMDRSGYDSYRLYSDSLNALGWAFLSYKVKAVPDEIATKLYSTRPGFKAYSRDEYQFLSETPQGIVFDMVAGFPVQWTLLAGHPTPKDTANGYRMKGSKKYPISEHNVWCDKECGRAMAKEFMRPEPAIPGTLI